MSLLPIYTFPYPTLSSVASPVSANDFAAGELNKLFEDMEETLLSTGGVGLAAPQVGISKRIIVIDEKLIETKDDDVPQHGFLRIVNPEIAWSSDDMQCDEEGCLSFPDVKVEVERAESVRVMYFDEFFNVHSCEANGLLARCFQHEIDHLDGITMPDRLKAKDKLRFTMAYAAHMEELGKPATFNQAIEALKKLIAEKNSSDDKELGQE